MKAFRIALWVAAALLAGATLAVFWSMQGANQNAIANEPYGSPFQLVDQNGDPVTEQALRGRPSAVFFGFTHCPEVCPTTLYELSGFQKEIAAEGAEPFQIVFVTVDPERDRPETLKSYVESVSDDVLAITGEPQAVAEMLKGWGVIAERDGEGENYNVNHTATTFLIDEEGRLDGTIGYGEDPEMARGKLERLSGV
ncbi:cytochrome-c oxidase assembly factor protein [Fulvimarina pelagi HTCC2506]|uniref:Cytochrome-c oxidase assembly factor protein n=1 Tax=Fulvimarina pelagi HTCC2506 TaxID=314231 RepID=Q0G3E4_9HYPH|nr:SCO family protein [Fulvimarina pelagi]EAU41887.1 cytochrome-c oxidase assembly factor protein [Fulvimarina pelagi HTCC2506]